MKDSTINQKKNKSSDHFSREDWASAYINVEKELTNVELTNFKGTIPKGLTGTLYRNGPGRLERGGQWVHHPFDGDGMVMAMSFKNGKVYFSNKFIRTEEWKAEEKAGRFLYRGVFGTQKKGGALNNAFDLRLKNIANTNVIKLGNKLLALWEAASPYAIDPESLQTYGISNLNGVLKEKESFSAHPRFDPGHHGDTRMVTFGVKTGPNSTVRLMEFQTQGPQAGKLISDNKYNFKGFAFLHDFAITPNWAIFLQNSINFNPLPFIFGQKGAAQCLTSKQNSKGKFWLIPRDCGRFANKQPLIFDAPEGFVFHHLNAYEEKNYIILDSIYYSDFPTIKPNENFKEINFDLIPEGKLKRCIFNLEGEQISEETLSEQCCEFAMVNPLFLGKNASFSWMACAEIKEGNSPLQAIKKLNHANGHEIFWSAAPRGFVSEPIMAPNQYSLKEDDGWILVLIWNGKRKGTDLVILNSSNLNEEAILELPIGIPHGLHGSWVSESTNSSQKT